MSKGSTSRSEQFGQLAIVYAYGRNSESLDAIQSIGGRKQPLEYATAGKAVAERELCKRLEGRMHLGGCLWGRWWGSDRHTTPPPDVIEMKGRKGWEHGA